MSYKNSLSCISRFCARLGDCMAQRSVIVFRKYKIAPRLGAQAVRRRLMARVRAERDRMPGPRSPASNF
jgi:hypothetical protein